MVTVIIQPTEQICIKKAMQLVSNWSKSTAQRKIDQCRDALKKTENGILSVDEFMQYYELKKIPGD
jgi:hypothetical protein